jgi:imidazole glycerol-phosphate synthase subunit HisH
MIVIFDLGFGNLSSVRSGFARAGGVDTMVIANAAAYIQLREAGIPIDGLVLPGVGAFGDAMFQLRARGLLPILRKAASVGTPVLGICLGMQLLFGMSEENGQHIGLGLLPGKVIRFRGPDKVPHMGWNDLTAVRRDPLTRGVQPGDYVYFVHSYHAVVQEQTNLLASCEYGQVTVPAVVAKGTVYGTQFHPEKSGQTGETILRNFVGICLKNKRPVPVSSGGEVDGD